MKEKKINMSEKYVERIKSLYIAELKNVKIDKLDEHYMTCKAGSFSRNDMIKEIENNTEFGLKQIDMLFSLCIDMMERKKIISIEKEIELVKWLKHIDNGYIHYNPETKEESASIGFSPFDCFTDNIKSEKELVEYYINSIL